MLVRLGGFIQSLAVVVMRPADLVEFTRHTYAMPRTVESWGREDLLASGLQPEEKRLLEKLPIKQGQLLLLGVGGGREAVPLAQMGFDVTGVDFIPEMLEKAKENAARRGVKIQGLVQDISRLDVPEASYDIVWLSAALYSYLPTRQRRVEMLKRVVKALRPGGYVACQFSWDPRLGTARKAAFVRKVFAWLCVGNLWYEKGDALWNNMEFIHSFTSEAELRSEFEDAGFEPVHIEFAENLKRGEAVLKRRLLSPQ
jgi:SAM-dependent methyltransferase